jgi:hypothetical protein
MTTNTKITYNSNAHACYNEHMQLHSPDADTPAVVSKEHGGYSTMFYHNGLLHRTSGPAVVIQLPQKTVAKWYIDGIHVLRSVDLHAYFDDITSPTSEELVIFKLTRHATELVQWR